MAGLFAALLELDNALLMLFVLAEGGARVVGGKLARTMQLEPRGIGTRIKVG